MKDQFGREIDYIRISVTDRCNLRCRYCMPPEGVPLVSHEEILRFDEIERLVKIFCAKGIKHVKITGGEPLARRGVSALVRCLKKLPGVETVSLTTNGTLLAGHLAALAEAGLDAVNISLDTPCAQRYYAITGGSVKDVFEALDACAAYPQIKVKLNCVLLADIPSQDFVALADIARSRNVDVRYIETMPIGLGSAFEGVKQETVLQLLQRTYGPADPCDEKRGHGPAVYWNFNGFRGRIGLISPISHAFCSRCNRLRLTAEGLLKPCLQYADGADLRALLRSGAEDAEIAACVEKMICAKPRGHCFTEAVPGKEGGNFQKEERLMSRIGG